jgi:adenylate cyclase
VHPVGGVSVIEEQAKRKLTAILSADVKGYSRLMEDDEEATVRTINAYREVMVEHITRQNGRVVDAKGDNILAEFASLVDAVRCAVEIQKGLGKRNAELPENRKMQFRIGVNLGDVIEEKETIYGDGVNIAARLEALADGGGVCISGTTFDHVEGKLGLEFEYLGEQSVKNIKKPVRVYRVRMEGSISDVETSRKLALPEKPSIAVLAFANMSGDSEQEYFSDGLTEEIITALSKVPHLFVIARNSTFTYKGKAVSVKQVGQELGVRYVLEGSVRKAGDRVRITAQLIDAAIGNHLWAERYDRELKDIFALQEEITLKILTALEVKLTEGEQARISVKGTSNLDAYLKVLQGREHGYRFTREGNVLARQMYEEAIALDPEYARAYWLLAIIHQADLFLGVSKNRSQSMARVKELAQKALAIDKSSANAHQALCFLYTMLRQYEKGIAEGERAVDLDPNSADSYSMLGMSFHFAGRYEQAIASLNKAIRLNPIPPTMYFLFLGNAYQLAGMYEESILAYKKVLDRNPDHLFAHLRLAATYILVGREEKARSEASEVVRIDPKFSIEPFAETVPYKKQADLELLVRSLRKAGLK